MVDAVFMGEKRIEKRIKIIFFRHKEFGYTAATQPEITEDIVGQTGEVGFGLRAVEHGCTIAVFPNNMRIGTKVIFKIPARIVAPGGNYGVESGKRTGFETYPTGHVRVIG